MHEGEVAFDRDHLPNNIKGRSIHSKIIPSRYNLEDLLNKLIRFYRDETKLRPQQFECYKSYDIRRVKKEILESSSWEWRGIIREHILNNPIEFFGKHLIDIYLVAYVSETYGSGKEKFFEYLKENNITEKESSMETIWKVGQGDGVYLGILEEDGKIKDWDFIKKWVS